MRSKSWSFTESEMRLAQAIRNSGLASDPFGDIEAFIGISRECNIEPDWRLINRFVAHSRESYAYVPPSLIEVCRGLARFRRRPFELALDPYARDGLLLSALCAEGIVLRSEGRCAPPTEWSDSRGIFLSAHPAVVPGQPLVDPDGSSRKIADEYDLRDDLMRVDIGSTNKEDLDLLAGDLDLVVCIPPFGERSPTKREGTHKYSQNQFFYEASQQIADSVDGIVVMLMPEFFWSHADSASLRPQLVSREDFRVEAALRLPAGSLPWTSLPSYILIAAVGLGHMPYLEGGRIFVAELNDDASRTEHILQNLFEGREGSDIALGARIDAVRFRGFTHFLALQDKAKAEIACGQSFTSISEVIRCVHDAAIEIEGGSALYLNVAAMGAAEFATSDFTVAASEPEDWITLDLLTDRVDPCYVAHWLESPLGRISRRAVGERWVRGQVDDLLRQLGVHIPEIDDQRRVVQIISRSRVMESRHRLAREEALRPGADLDSISAAYDAAPASCGPSLEVWSESLPFPLASILRRYHRFGGNSNEAVRVLDHFFEAFAAFWATIMISALEQVGGVPGPLSAEIERDLRARRISPLERSTMSTWCFVGGKISKWLCEQLSSAAECEPRLDAFACLGTRKPEVRDALLSRVIPQVLHRASILRNDHRGHGGVIDGELANQLLSQYLDETNILKDAVGDIFDSLKLYRTGACRKRDGIRLYEAEVLQGSNSAFLCETLRLEDEPNSGSLVLCAGEGRCLPLVPFIVMGPSQETGNACYFYSKRVCDQSARYVSYHQGDHAADVRPEPLEFLDRWHSSHA